MEITFVRHGETVGNQTKVVQGHIGGELNDVGVAQAEIAGRRLAEHTFDLVITSDLDRAVQTAAGLGYPDAERVPAFREQHMGAWEGLPYKQVQEDFAEEIEALRNGEDVRLGGGESLSEFKERSVGAVQSVVDRLDDGESALVVSHGGTIFTIVADHLEFEGRPNLGRVQNTSFSTLRWLDGAPRLQRYNDAGHLAAVNGPINAALEEGSRLLTLVRHAETKANENDLWQGQTDQGINSNGEAQLLDLVGFYGKVHPVYASPLGRAQLTAAALSEGAIETVNELMEIDMGGWESLTSDEIQERWADDWHAIYQLGEDRPRGTTGERFSDVGVRMTSAIERILEADDSTHITVVSHGMAIHSYLTNVLGLEHGTRRKIVNLHNTGIAHVLIDDKGPILADFNVAPHIKTRTAADD